MTQPIAANDVLEVALEGTVEQQPWTLVRHWIVESVSDTEGLLAALRTHYANSIVAPWEIVASSLWVAECLTISRVAPGPRNPDFFTFTPAVVGDITTDGLPPMNAVLVRLSSDEPGQRNQGRAYLSGCPEASTNGGVLLASVVTEWQAVADGLMATISEASGTLNPCIFSHTSYRIQLDPPDGPITHPADVADYTAIITSAALQGNLATIRRRRTKRSSFSS